ncbi:MAG: hypothetical protein E5V40_23080, partial [Mesorhizobium sp.]
MRLAFQFGDHLLRALQPIGPRRHLGERGKDHAAPLQGWPAVPNQGPLERAESGLRLSLLELQQRKAGLRVPARGVGRAIGCFGLGEIAGGKMNVTQDAQRIASGPRRVECKLVERGTHQRLRLFQRAMDAEHLG